MLRDRIFAAIYKLAEQRSIQSFTQLSLLIREVVGSLVSTDSEEEELRAIDGPGMVEELCDHLRIVHPENLIAIQRALVKTIIKERITDSDHTIVRALLDEYLDSNDISWLLPDDRDNLIDAVLYDIDRIHKQNNTAFNNIMNAVSPYRNLVKTCKHCVKNNKTPMLVSTCTRQHCKRCGRIYWIHPLAIPFKDLPEGDLFRLISDDETIYIKVPLTNTPTPSDERYDAHAVPGNMIVVQGRPNCIGLSGRCGHESKIVPEKDFSIAGGVFTPN